MLIGIACLVIGIVGFVKGRINVSRNRELRGRGLYLVAALFCLPLPLTFTIGLVIGASHAASGKPLDPASLIWVDVVFMWVPILLGIALGFVFSEPKATINPTGGPVGGFPVMPPAPPAQTPTQTPQP